MVLRPPELAVAAAASAAAASVGAAFKPSFRSIFPLAVAVGGRRRDIAREAVPESSQGSEWQEWKIVSSKELGINRSMIPQDTRNVLKKLIAHGYDAYLVGGCVRDLIMKRTPKDYDVITTASLLEVQRAFRRCLIVGRRFPICHVHMKNSIVEVSTFDTATSKSSKNILTRKPDCDERNYLRWRNCLCRDFTVNGLMFDPYSYQIYDYLGGLEDIKKSKIRSVGDPRNSFQEDCARILRAIRIAARLGFSFSKETALCLRDLSQLVLRLDKSRILMELNYMLAYGSAEPSLRLLWRFGLLEYLLPVQAAYFVSHHFKRRDKGTNMLLALFSNLDRFLAPDKPCHSSLWISILAFHQALVLKPRDPLVIATFALALRNGGDMTEAVNIAMWMDCRHDANFSELLALQDLQDESLVLEVLSLASSVITALGSMTDEYFVSKALARYPTAPSSDLVFIPLQAYLKVCDIFKCLQSREKEKGFVPKGIKTKIGYPSLADGRTAELRYVLAMVIFDTVFPQRLEPHESDAESMEPCETM